VKFLWRKRSLPSVDDNWEDPTRPIEGRPKPLNVNINNKDRTLEVMNPEDFITKIGWYLWVNPLGKSKKL
jgi:hypothetical protein